MRGRPRLLRSVITLLALAMFNSSCGDGTIEQVGSTALAPASTAPATDHMHSGHPRLLKQTRAPDGRIESLYVISSEPTVEVTAYEPGLEPSATQRAAAEQLERDVAETLRAWPTIAAARDGGFEVYDYLGPSHLVNMEYVEDGRTVDPARPEFLLVDPTGAVSGVMFLAASNSARGPQVGGPATVWHYHTYPTEVCWQSGGLLPAVDPLGDQADCPAGALRSDRSPEMLHVWTVDHPLGSFSSSMEVFDDGRQLFEP